MSRAIVHLKPKKERPVVRGHMWIFSGAVSKMSGTAEEGDVVEVVAASGEALGSGHYQAEGSIRVRMLSTGDEIWTDGMYQSRIENAFSTRKQLGLVSGSNNMFRLIHGEGDLLPGLIIDIYGSTAIIECHTAGMERSAEIIADAVIEVLERKLETVYVKSKISGTGRFIKGESGSGIGLENDISFKVDWEKGQKTGFFLDQRDNRALLAKYASGKSVLNTFCYTGGFSMYALKAGAQSVISVDSSQGAIDTVNENIALNKLSGTHEAICSDAMEYLKTLEEEFDIIVLDPPAFAKHKRARHNAVQAYKRINQMAIAKVKRGGLVFTFSCSQVVDTQLFKDTVISAAMAEGRSVRLLHQLHQAPDHPVNVSNPQSEYLKGLVIRVD